MLLNHVKRIGQNTILIQSVVAALPLNAPDQASLGKYDIIHKAKL